LCVLYVCLAVASTELTVIRIDMLHYQDPSVVLIRSDLICEAILGFAANYMQNIRDEAVD
jgi:hypothetical protein